MLVRESNLWNCFMGNLFQTLVYFVLSNEGQGALYPLQPFKERLVKAVRLGEIYFKVPVDTGETPLKKITAVGLSAISTFDFLCRPPYTTAPASKTTATFTKQPLKTTSQISPYVDYSSTTKPTTTPPQPPPPPPTTTTKKTGERCVFDIIKFKF